MQRILVIDDEASIRKALHTGEYAGGSEPVVAIYLYRISMDSK